MSEPEPTVVEIEATALRRILVAMMIGTAVYVVWRSIPLETKVRAAMKVQGWFTAAPCEGCGQDGVEEIAATSAELASTNGHVDDARMAEGLPE